MSLGEHLKQAREKAGYSQKQAAKKIGITDSRLSKMERDINSCPPGELRRLAELYETSVIDLYLEAGYITKDDLSNYQMVFQGVSSLDDKEKEHIQQCIDLLTRRKDQI